MGFTDDYKNESGFGKGKHELTVQSVKFVTSRDKGTPGIEITYYTSSPDHAVRKTLYRSKMLNRFLTSWILGLGLNPRDMEQAAKNGLGDDWLLDNMRNKSGIFEFVETDRVSEKTGRPFLEPKSVAEVEFDEWLKSQGNSPTAPEPTAGNRFADGSSPDDSTPPDFPSDIPF